MRAADGRRRILAATAALVALAAVGLAVADPFAGHAASPSSSLDNGAAISLSRVERTTLASRTLLDGTLGYAGTWTISVPAGIDPAGLARSEQAVRSARAALTAARATATADAGALRRARAALRATRRQRAACDRASGCASAVPTAANAVAGAHARSVGDDEQLITAHGALAIAHRALTAAESSATSYSGGSIYTRLPLPGRIVRRGQRLFAIDDEPTLLLYASAPMWRAFRPRMPPGPDVAALNANLRALGYRTPLGNSFTSATSIAISALQRRHGLAQTGRLDLGAVVFEPSALRVKTVGPTAGQAVQPGPLLTASSTRLDVSIPLDVAQQPEVRVGDRVGVTLPDNRTTPGVVSSVGRVAGVSPSDQQRGGAAGSATVDVHVRLRDAGAAAHLDEAPVAVSITAHSAANVLAVPVNALVALAGGGYAVEVAGTDRPHRLTAVTPGLFDDAQGLVQVTGSGLAAGDRVVVPAS